MARHPGVRALMRWLEPNPKLPERQKEIAQDVYALAIQMLNTVPEDTPELTAGLRKLLEAKDCFVRASMESTDDG